MNMEFHGEKKAAPYVPCNLYTHKKTAFKMNYLSDKALLAQLDQTPPSQRSSDLN